MRFILFEFRFENIYRSGNTDFVCRNRYCCGDGGWNVNEPNVGMGNVESWSGAVQLSDWKLGVD